MATLVIVSDDETKISFLARNGKWTEPLPFETDRFIQVVYVSGQMFIIRERLSDTHWRLTRVK